MKRSLVAVAVLVVALGVVFLILCADGDVQVGARSEESPGGHPPRATAAGAEGSRAPEVASRAGQAKVRRLKSKAERERLVAFIENALRARRAASRGGEDEETDSGGGEGSLSKSTIREGMHAVIGDIKACYERALERTPTLEGRLVALFEIIGEPDAGGVIEHAEIGDATDAALRAEAELTGCIIDSIYTIELPRPENGGRVTVEYPFFLSPGDGGR